MRRVFPVALTVLAVAASFVLSTLSAAEDDKPKFTIKEAMKAHAKEKLHTKVIEGKASDEEKDKLVALYEALGKNKPPKGDADSWKTLTDELVAAAKDAKEGKEGAGDRLKKAVDCGACHKVHK